MVPLSILNRFAGLLESSFHASRLPLFSSSRFAASSVGPVDSELLERSQLKSKEEKRI